MDNDPADDKAEDDSRHRYYLQTWAALLIGEPRYHLRDRYAHQEGCPELEGREQTYESTHDSGGGEPGNARLEIIICAHCVGRQHL